jgi:hypothetical protein
MLCNDLVGPLINARRSPRICLTASGQPRTTGAAKVAAEASFVARQFMQLAAGGRPPSLQHMPVVGWLEAAWAFLLDEEHYRAIAA